jgi:hypothetical protein
MEPDYMPYLNGTMAFLSSFLVLGMCYGLYIGHIADYVDWQIKQMQEGLFE